MKVYPSAISSSSIEVTWSYDLGDVVPDGSVTIKEYDKNRKQIDSKPNLAPLTGIAVFENLSQSTQYWYLWCGVYSGVGGDTTHCQDPADAVSQTTLPTGVVTGGPSLKPPVINKLDPEPAGIRQGNSIGVSWSSPTAYDKFLVWWTENGIPRQQGEIEGQKSSSGSWRAQTVPGSYYTFQVKGGVGAGWGYNYSDWGPSVRIKASLNLISLRQFLTHSSVNPVGASLRSLMPAGDTLRKFMQL